MQVRELGQVPYIATVEAMKAFTKARGTDTPDELWILEHPPIFTQGISGKSEHLLAPGDIEVIQTDRGGQVTYHGPGQIVIYVLCDIRRAKLGVRDLVTALEGAIISYLAELQIEAIADPEGARCLRRWGKNRCAWAEDQSRMQLSRTFVECGS
jgi:lipoyl(octanoyl) transferase